MITEWDGSEAQVLIIDFDAKRDLVVIRYRDGLTQRMSARALESQTKALTYLN